MKKVREMLNHMTMRTKILITITLVTCSMMGILTIFMFQQTVNTIKKQALYSYELNTQKTASLLDSKLEVIKEMSEKLNMDERLYTVFSSLDKNNELSLMKANETITSILRDYIPWYSNIYSVHLVTPYYRFGEEDKNYYPNFTKSKIYRDSVKATGSLIWFPTYSYTSMYGINNLKDSQLSYGSLFTAARLMNLIDVTSGKIKHLSSIMENPILVINFTPDYFREIFSQYATNDSLSDTGYYVMTGDKDVVYCTEDKNNLDDQDWIEGINFDKAYGGFTSKNSIIVGYAKSNICGWNIVMEIPINNLVGEFRKEYLSSFIVMLFVLMLVAFILAYLVSVGINKSFYKVLEMIKNIGEGNFDKAIVYDNKDEFSFFYKKLNAMNQDLHNLIHENFEVKIAQRDAQLRALNTQLNPHFIYNTLNVINWTCLDGKMLDASNMIVNLSRMLQYTTYHNDPEELLSDDLEWLKKYLEILRTRFADKFDVKIGIPEELLDIYVPKLFLQPFVENAVIHGFKDMKDKGLLEISAERSENEVIFYVDDNGKGMTSDEIDSVLNKKKSSIGMMNVNEIIRIMYGQQYGVRISSQIGEGTSVEIHIPLQKVQ